MENKKGPILRFERLRHQSISCSNLYFFLFLFLQKEEHFNPTAFFLILLPPIIFESGYSLHKVGYKLLNNKLFTYL